MLEALTPHQQAALGLAIAALLDWQIGDPPHWWHPVQGMGIVIHHGTQRIRRWCATPWSQRLAGVGLGVGVIGGTGAIAWGLRTVAWHQHPVLGLAVESVALASCFAGHSLRAAAVEVLTQLQTGDLPRTRQTLSRYVGRDTDQLTAPEIQRAVLETVTENGVDGVLAPLFWAIAGAFLPGVGSLPLAMAYKAASTLDSMVGYRRAPYTDLGWFSARTEDVLTWLPCRLAVLTLAGLSGRPWRVVRLCWRDARQDPSPNAGWSECAYAAALGVQVGGANTYHGVVKQKPLLGEPCQPITTERIQAAMRLTQWTFLLWLGGAIAILSNL